MELLKARVAEQARELEQLRQIIDFRPELIGIRGETVCPVRSHPLCRRRLLPTELLRQTYAQETALFQSKREHAENQRLEAQAEFEKIVSKKRSAFGNIRVAHSDVSWSVRMLMFDHILSLSLNAHTNTFFLLSFFISLSSVETP